MEEGIMSDWKAAIFCLALYLVLTVGQWVLGKAFAKDHKERLVAPSRTWMLTCIPVVSAVYYVITDGLSTLQLEFVKYILIWAIAMSVLHVVANKFDSFVLEWGNKKLIVDLDDKSGASVAGGRRADDHDDGDKHE